MFAVLFAASSLTLAFAPAVAALLPIIKVLAPPAIAWLGWRLERWIATKTKNEKVRHALDVLVTAVSNAVLRTQQVYVDDLIAKSADGKLTESEQRQAFTAARDAAIATLPPEVKDLLEAYFGPAAFSVTVGTMVEAQVQRNAFAKQAKVARLVADVAKKK